MKKLIANTLVKWFKQFPYFGRQRFWMLYWAYRITGWHIRHQEWDFILDYLPSLAKWQSVSVLDVGCSRNLFCYEIVGRCYKLTGIDLEEPNFKYCGQFIYADVRTLGTFTRKFNFITCISVLEHIEDINQITKVDNIGEQGQNIDGQKLALRNMIDSLKIGGRLLLTIPTHEFAQGHPWHGFSMTDVINILPKNAMIQECTERAGQLCFSIQRTE